MLSFAFDSNAGPILFFLVPLNDEDCLPISGRLKKDNAVILWTGWMNAESSIGVDPFGGAKPSLLRQGKEARLRVNPCLPAGRLSKLRPSGRGVERLT
jgi:hypothetical protein